MSYSQAIDAYRQATGAQGMVNPKEAMAWFQSQRPTIQSAADTVNQAIAADLATTPARNIPSPVGRSPSIGSVGVQGGIPSPALISPEAQAARAGERAAAQAAEVDAYRRQLGNEAWPDYREAMVGREALAGQSPNLRDVLNWRYDQTNPRSARDIDLQGGNQTFPVLLHENLGDSPAYQADVRQRVYADPNIGSQFEAQGQVDKANALREQFIANDILSQKYSGLNNLYRGGYGTDGTRTLDGSKSFQRTVKDSSLKGSEMAKLLGLPSTELVGLKARDPYELLGLNTAGVRPQNERAAFLAENMARLGIGQELTGEGVDPDARVKVRTLVGEPLSPALQGLLDSGELTRSRATNMSVGSLAAQPAHIQNAITDNRKMIAELALQPNNRTTNYISVDDFYRPKSEGLTNYSPGVKVGDRVIPGRESVMDVLSDVYNSAIGPDSGVVDLPLDRKNVSRVGQGMSGADIATFRPSSGIAAQGWGNDNHIQGQQERYGDFDTNRPELQMKTVEGTTYDNPSSLGPIRTPYAPIARDRYTLDELVGRGGMRNAQLPDVAGKVTLMPGGDYSPGMQAAKTVEQQLATSPLSILSTTKRVVGANPQTGKVEMVALPAEDYSTDSTRSFNAAAPEVVEQKPFSITQEKSWEPDYGQPSLTQVGKINQVGQNKYNIALGQIGDENPVGYGNMSDALDTLVTTDRLHRGEIDPTAATVLMDMDSGKKLGYTSISPDQRDYHALEPAGRVWGDPTEERLSDQVARQNLEQQAARLGGSFTPTETLKTDPRVAALREKAIAAQGMVDAIQARDLDQRDFRAAEKMSAIGEAHEQALEAAAQARNNAAMFDATAQRAVGQARGAIPSLKERAAALVAARGKGRVL